MKKGILAVSFGTTHEDTRKSTIEVIENRIKSEFSDCEIKRAFTSHTVIRKLKKDYDIDVDTPEEALLKFKEEGFEEIIVQPLHLIPGEEFDYIKKIVSHKFKNYFKTIEIGRPLLYFKGEEKGIPDDYTLMVEALKKQIPENKTVILMGHGSTHPANAVYGCFQCVLEDEGLDKIYMATVEGYPSLDRIIRRLEKLGEKEVTLMPFMLVAGDHAKNDMAGDEEDSWKSILESKGYKVHLYLHGLGENKHIQDIYIQHLRDVVEGKYKGLGKTKKGKK